MLEGLLEYMSSRSGSQLARDALDVFLVYYVFYRALLVLRGTRAMQVGVGLGVVFLLYVFAQLLQLVTVLSIMSALISSIILVIVVVFQNDIRRGLQRVGSRAWFGSLARAQESRVIEEVVEAATDLARHRIGAIITFEQDANLDEFVGVHKGHELDASVTRELLVSLFIPEAMNKLHDGAVVIRNLRIAKAGVFFPMPEGRMVDESFGSRHRAALGITEETDAVVVVVSEERGTISFCFNGNIASNLDGPKLKTMLEAIFSPKVRKKSRKVAAKRLSAPPPPMDTEVPSSKRPEAPRLQLRPSGDAESPPAPRVARSSPEVTPQPTSKVRPSGATPEGETPPPLRPRPAVDTEATRASGAGSAAAPLRTPVSGSPAEAKLAATVTEPILRDAVEDEEEEAPADSGRERGDR
jgi:diadenylate cyclase